MSYKLGQTLYYCIEEYESATYTKPFMVRRRWMDGVVINKDSGGVILFLKTYQEGSFAKYIPNKFLYESKIPTERVEKDRVVGEFTSFVSEVEGEKNV